MGFSNSKEETQKVRLPKETQKEQVKCESKAEQPKMKYERIALLGEGTSGKVFECVDINTKQHYAMKIVTLISKTKAQAVQEIENLKREIGLLKKLNHKNIVKYVSFSVSQDLKSVQIVLEKVTPGNLRDLVKNKPLTELQASKICRQLLHALTYLHSKGVIHRDLKGANILINEEGVPKLTDFGTATVVKSPVNDNIAVRCRSLKGTPYWMAPEVLKRTGHTFSADIWSLGCTLIEMLTGKSPWSDFGDRFEDIIRYIASGIQPPFPKNISKACQSFLNCCLDTNPFKRLKAQELLNHPFIREPINDYSIQQIVFGQLQALVSSELGYQKSSCKLNKHLSKNKLLEQLTNKANQIDTSQIRADQKKFKDNNQNYLLKNSKKADVIETIVSKKEREEVLDIQRRKQTQKRQKALKWEQELRIEAMRISNKTK